MNCKFELRYKIDGLTKTVSENENDDLKLDFSDDGKIRKVTLTAKRDLVLSSYGESENDFSVKETDYNDPKGDLCFLNGYQSWTDTKESYGDAKEKNVKKLPAKLVETFAFDRYGDAFFYDYDKNILHGYDVFYVKGKHPLSILNLNAENGYLIIEVRRKTGAISLLSDIDGKKLAAGESFVVIYYAYSAEIDDYRLIDEFFPKKSKEKIFGYTSWYNYYQNVNENILLRDLDALDDRFNLFQIDDGYETFVGDWLDVDRNKFPDGLKPIVDKIHERRFKAGIWLAPFVAEEESRLFKENKSWFKKFPDGEYVKCGSNWSGFYALDLEKEEVRDYIEKCLKTYSDMGFDFFKLDFLYAANLPVYEGKTRSGVAEDAYAFLREVLKDKLILGCGATLFNAIGKFDYMRVGPDVSLKFDDVWYMRFMHRERISTKITLQNTIYRSFMNGRFFGNDPDVFLLRDDNISLSEKQKLSLITINALFGSVMMTSDNIADYDEKKRDILSGALDLFHNAKVESFARCNDKITVNYSINGKHEKIIYDTERGILL